MSATRPRHPRVLTRTVGLLEDPADLVIYAPEVYMRSWIDGELEGTGAVTKLALAIPDIVAALVHEPAPRPRVLILHVDRMAATELRALRELRDGAWTGTIIAVGDHGVPLPLRLELGIEFVLRSPFARDQLRGIVAKILPNAESSIYKRETVPMEPIAVAAVPEVAGVTPVGETEIVMLAEPDRTKSRRPRANGAAAFDGDDA